MREEESTIAQTFMGFTTLGFLALGLPAFFLLEQFTHAGPDAVANVRRTVAVYGCEDGVQGFSTGGGICNIGDDGLPGSASIDGDHAVWTQNLYRLMDDRFMQLGLAWVKHDNWTSALGDCEDCGIPKGGCGSDVGLPAGCRDTYAACQNGLQLPAYGDCVLDPRSQINPTTGVWSGSSATHCNAASGDVIACRLQVKSADLVEAVPYFVEQQVITPSEETSRTNNVSYRAANIGGCDTELCSGAVPGCTSENQSCTGTGCGCPRELTIPNSTHWCQEPAIRAWQDNDSSVVESPDISDGDGGTMILAAKAWNVDEGIWEYEYALYNMNSDLSARSFCVPLPTDVSVTNIGFHDVDYHSGEPYDGTDWPGTVVSGAISWKTDPYTTTPDANALRWGTLYNFRFRADSAPVSSTAVQVGLFKPPYGTLAPLSVAPVASPATGACCLDTGCTITTSACCAAQSGTFQGTGTDCQSTGTCCVGSTCTVTQACYCLAQGGTFGGTGTLCQCTDGKLPCELASSKRACCLSEEGPCVLMTEVCCLQTGGWYFGSLTQCHPWTCGQINGPSQGP